jgi:PAS domain-containing protein
MLELQVTSQPENDAHALLREALDGIIQVTGASAGWISLATRRGLQDFLVRRGDFSNSWIELQKGGGGIWGFRVHEGPVLLNEFPALSILGDPPLRNLLSCPLTHEAQVLGHVLLANKATGFTSQDAMALQSVSQVLGRQIPCIATLSERERSSMVLRRGLDHAQEGVLILNHHNELIHVNETWCRWTGFSSEELCGSTAPYPYWVSHRDLAHLDPGIELHDFGILEFLPGKAGPGLKELAKTRVSTTKAGPSQAAMPVDADGHARSNRFPFRDRGGNVFWCHVTTVQEEIEGESLNLVYLRRAALEQKPAPGPIAAEHRVFAAAQNLVLLLPAHGPPEFWDARWERLTGLRASDLAGASRELVLDWLFPRERDRAYVADLLCQPSPDGGRAALDVVCPEGSRPMECTFLPVNPGPTIDLAASPGPSASLAGTVTPSPRGTAWLLIAAPASPISGESLPALPRLGQYAQGLSQVLNRYLTGPLSVAETALDRPDLPADIAALFSRILEGCQRMSRLVSSLQDLAVETVGQTQRLTLAVAVRESVEDHLAEIADPGLESSLEAQDPGVQVDVNPRMLRLVLQHLLSNAVQAMAGRPRRRIQVRVFADETEAFCQIQDSGVGLPAMETALAFAPFFSTKGPFAQEARLAALDSAGLGLTVCRHLLELHGGRLELRRATEQGTIATFTLPRAVPVLAGQLSSGFDASQKP